MLWWILGPLGGLAVLVAVLFAIGSIYPQDHAFLRKTRVNRPPEDVWKTITDYKNAPAWNPLVKDAERLPDVNGNEAWRETLRDGPPMVLETIESKPPRRLVRKIGDPKLAFSGRWEFDVEPSDGGCTIRLGEYGVVPNPLFRFMVRVVGPGRYVEEYLAALAKKLGETSPRIVLE